MARPPKARRRIWVAESPPRTLIAGRPARRARAYLAYRGTLSTVTMGAVVRVRRNAVVVPRNVPVSTTRSKGSRSNIERTTAWRTS
jgi:hypothetical protein